MVLSWQRIFMEAGLEYFLIKYSNFFKTDIADSSMKRRQCSNVNHFYFPEFNFLKLDLFLNSCNNKFFSVT